MVSQTTCVLKYGFTRCNRYTLIVQTPANCLNDQLSHVNQICPAQVKRYNLYVLLFLQSLGGMSSVTFGALSLKLSHQSHNYFVPIHV